MRVLHLGKYYAPQHGGIERYTRDLAEWLVAQGDRVSVLVHQRPGRWRGSRESLDGVELRRVGSIAELVYAPLSPSYPFALARALREFQPHLLHLHLPNPSCFAALASPAARRLPWIVHWHADVSPDSHDWRLRAAYRAYRPFEQAVLARAHSIIATSQPYLDASQALAPWRAKVAVVPLGTNERTDVPPKPDLWPQRSGLRLLAVGRLSHYKGFDTLIAALEQLPDASLLLVGSGECGSHLRAEAAARGLADRIAFAGVLDDATLAAAYAGADVFVLPSLDRSEAFGLVLLEAMQSRLPVVASAVEGSGIGSVVCNGDTGLLAPPGDSGALAHALEQMLDASLRARFGTAGHTRWQERFTLAKSAAAVRAIYRTIAH